MRLDSLFFVPIRSWNREFVIAFALLLNQISLYHLATVRCGKHILLRSRRHSTGSTEPSLVSFPFDRLLQIWHRLHSDLIVYFCCVSHASDCDLADFRLCSDACRPWARHRISLHIEQEIVLRAFGSLVLELLSVLYPVAEASIGGRPLTPLARRRPRTKPARSELSVAAPSWALPLLDACHFNSSVSVGRQQVLVLVLAFFLLHCVLDRPLVDLRQVPRMQS